MQMFLKPRVRDFLKYGFNGWDGLTKGFGSGRVIAYPVYSGGDMSDVEKGVVLNQISRFLHPDILTKMYPNFQSDRVTIYVSCEFPFGRRKMRDNAGDINDDVGFVQSMPSDWKPDIIAKLQETCRELDKKTSEKNILMINILFRMLDKDGKAIPVLVNGEYEGNLAENTTLITTADSYSEIYKSAASKIDDMEPPLVLDPSKRTDKITQKPVQIEVKESDGTTSKWDIAVKICLDVTKEFVFTGKHPDKVDIEIHEGFGIPDMKDRNINARFLFSVDFDSGKTFAFETVEDKEEPKENKDVNKLLAVRTGLEWVSLVLSEAGVYETVPKTVPKGPQKEVLRTKDGKPVVSHNFKNRSHEIDGYPFVELATFEIPKDMDQVQATEGLAALKKDITSHGGKAEIKEDGERGEGDHPLEPLGEHPGNEFGKDRLGQEGRRKGL